LLHATYVAMDETFSDKSGETGLNRWRSDFIG
jgi:hypothetical protein